MWLITCELFDKYDIDIPLAKLTKTKSILEERLKMNKLNARILTHLLRSDLIT